MSFGYVEIDRIVGPMKAFSKEAVEKYRQQAIRDALERQEEIMTEQNFTKRLVRLAKDLDKLHSMVDATIKDIKTLMPPEKPKDEPDK